jgi:hypothetical protein
VTTLISTCNTKTEFTKRVRDGVNVHLFDPTATHGAMTSLRDMQDNAGYSFTVTDNRRRWFASVTVKAGRKMVVK